MFNINAISKRQKIFVRGSFHLFEVVLEEFDSSYRKNFLNVRGRNTLRRFPQSVGSSFFSHKKSVFQSSSTIGKANIGSMTTP